MEEDGPGERIAAFEYAFARGQVVQVIDAAADSGMLTSAGAELIAGLRRRIASWTLRPAGAAQLALDAHRAGWRLRHLRPDPAGVRAVAASWAAGRDEMVPPQAKVLPGGSGWWSRPRLALIRRTVVARAHGRTLPGAESLDAAESALVSGHYDVARSAFRARIADDPDDLEAWTGLGLATAGPERTALLEQPALVRAVHLQLGSSVDPLALARWIGRAVSGGADANGS